MTCPDRARDYVGLSDGISVTVSVPSNKARVVVVNTLTLGQLMVPYLIVMIFLRWLIDLKWDELFAFSTFIWEKFNVNSMVL